LNTNKGPDPEEAPGGNFRSSLNCCGFHQ
jgi:hypothetical protein